ncbi:DUF6961 family protein [Sphingobium sp. KCTC 72723]|uniref:DUF6961 family protein n=1 Tax=Sphingobium sp. KCTC 72723 TaxID=2733867 RepID=UPI00165D5474|nr:hypothetical protein [Sphingobium sp. KCTC 72723]
MPTDWELWACAQKLIKQHQAKAPLQVAIRIAELATDGDADGVRTWQAVGERVDQLMDYRVGRPLSKH